MTLFELAEIVNFTFDTDFVDVKTKQVYSIMDLTINKMKKKKVVKITPKILGTTPYLRIEFK